MRNLLSILTLALIISCESDKNTNKIKTELVDSIEGFWERIGTIQMVNGIAVDTIPFKDEFGTRQVKAYVDGDFLWFTKEEVPKLFKDADIETPWKSGAGGYGKYTFEYNGESSKMIENMTNIVGNGVLWPNLNSIGAMKDSINKNAMKWEFTANLQDSLYSQIMTNVNDNNIQYAEYFKLMNAGEPSSIDGSWEHIANVKYINDIPVDTIALPEGLKDHKILKNGYAIVNYDFTLAKQGDKNWGGAALMGKFTYKDGILTEFFETGTGNWIPLKGWSETGQTAKIDMIDNDTFIQINNYFGVDDGKGNVIFKEASTEKTGLLHIRVK